jgi:hypothetical protein
MKDEITDTKPVTVSDDALELPVPGHHAMARAAFSWSDMEDELELELPTPGHHAMARAAFSWGDLEN